MISGLLAGGAERAAEEKKLYQLYTYFIEEGRQKYSLNYDDSFSAYSDAVLSVIVNISSGRFDGRSSIKTYLHQIFCNKCIDLVRKITTNKEQVHQTLPQTELLTQLPDGARNIVQRLMDQQKLQAIRRQLQMIGEKCKEILFLFEEGLSDRQIADKLHYNSPAVAKTTRLRCLERLREKLGG